MHSYYYFFTYFFTQVFRPRGSQFFSNPQNSPRLSTAVGGKNNARSYEPSPTYSTPSVPFLSAESTALRNTVLALWHETAGVLQRESKYDYFINVFLSPSLAKPPIEFFCFIFFIFCGICDCLRGSPGKTRKNNGSSSTGSWSNHQLGVCPNNRQRCTKV